MFLVIKKTPLIELGFKSLLKWVAACWRLQGEGSWWVITTASTAATEQIHQRHSIRSLWSETLIMESYGNFILIWFMLVLPSQLTTVPGHHMSSHFESLASDQQNGAVPPWALVTASASRGPSPGRSYTPGRSQPWEVHPDGFLLSLLRQHPRVPAGSLLAAVLRGCRRSVTRRGRGGAASLQEARMEGRNKGVGCLGSVGFGWFLAQFCHVLVARTSLLSLFLVTNYYWLSINIYSCLNLMQVAGRHCPLTAGKVKKTTIGWYRLPFIVCWPLVSINICSLLSMNYSDFSLSQDS